MATLRTQSHPSNGDSTGSPSPPGAPRELRNYRLDRRIGQDELAVFYRATHLALDRPVLVAVLHRTDWISSSRFQLAARLAAHLAHPNLLPVIDAGHDDRIGHYLVTPYLDTRSLQDVLTAEGALDPVQALRIATQLASVIDYLHSQNVVHRDIQPANILITPQGTTYLTNLSLAASPDTPDLSSIDDTDYRTPYTAPEQTLRTGQPTPASDLYSFGAVLYHMLSGEMPPVGAAPSLTLRDETLAAADRVIQRLMAEQPSQRYSSAGQALSALRQALRSQIDAATVDMEESRWEPVAEWLENPLETVLGSMLDADFVARSRTRADTLHRVDAVRRLLDRWSRQNWTHRPQLGHLIEPEQIVSYNLYFYELRVTYETRTPPQVRFSVHRGGALSPEREVGLWEAQVPDVPPFESHPPETIVIRGSQKVVGCQECGGTGRIPCRTCNATGAVMRSRRVREPDGSVRVEQLSEECPTCRGYGREMCERCEGVGQMLEEKVFNWSRHARVYFNEDDLSGLHRPTLKAKALQVFNGPISLREGHWYQVAPLKEMIEEAQRNCDSNTRVIATELTICGVPVTEVDYRFRDQPRTLAFIGFDNTLKGDSTLYDIERIVLYIIILIMAIILALILVLR